MKTIKFLINLSVYFSIISPVIAQSQTKEFFKVAKLGQVELVKNYIENGIDINAIDKNQRTILMFAAKSGYEDLLIYLIRYGANIELKDINGDKAKDFAIKKKQSSAVDILSFAEAKNINTKSSYVKYLTDYPKGKYKTEAETAIENFNYIEILTKNNIEAYQTFIKNYPNTKYKNDIESRMDTLEYLSIDSVSVSSYIKYLKMYPSGIFSFEAQRKRDSLLQDIQITDNELKLLISKIEELVFPFTIEEIYVECTPANDNLTSPNTQHISGISTMDMQLGDKKIKYRTSKRVADKDISTKVTILEGQYAIVQILKGKETLLDIYSGDYKGKELITVLSLYYPSKGFSKDNFYFEKVFIYEGDTIIEYLVNGGNWYKL